MTRIGRDIVIYTCTALGSLIAYVWIIPAYTPPYPGFGVRASLLPNVALGIILVFSGVGLARNLAAHFRQRGAKAQESQAAGGRQQEGRVHLGHLALFLAPCALLMPAMDWIGFIPAGLVFMLVLQYLCGQRRPVPALLVALGTVFLAYAAMRYGFNVPLP